MPVGNKMFQGEFTEVSEMSNQSIINKRRIINGYDDGLLQASPLKTPFGHEISSKECKKIIGLLKRFRSKKIKSSGENNELTEQEKKCF